ncbi:MAG: DinB family protein [Gemmatimonadetes bacterium]|nr:DinB family protein [Gemmatimonadota bacterium]
MSELADLREHLERYRAVTHQALDLVTDEDLGWRPGPELYTLGQQFLHIAQSEDLQIPGLLRDDWDYERGRFPARELKVDELRELLDATRKRTMVALSELNPGCLGEPVDLGEGKPTQTLRWWLWLMVEHEVHHKAQIAVYLRQMGKTPPFFAEALEDGARPDIEIREKMGGF